MERCAAAAGNRAMSVTTKTGDQGWTKLLFDRRIRKDDRRVEAYGAVDELNSFLGLAKAKLRSRSAKKLIHSVQWELFIVGSELATLPRDLKRLELRVDEKRVRRLEEEIAKREKRLKLEHCCFLIPGDNETSALLDVCRCVCRRAERAVVRLRARKGVTNPLVPIYLNRLSDLLFLLAHAEEKKHEVFSAKTVRGRG